MIRQRAVTNTVNPPGQARYLRDVIKKYYEEERAVEAAKPYQATTGPTDAEKRLENVLVALAGLSRQALARHGPNDGWWSQELLKIVKENS